MKSLLLVGSVLAQDQIELGQLEHIQVDQERLLTENVQEKEIDCKQYHHSDYDECLAASQISHWRRTYIFKCKYTNDKLGALMFIKRQKHERWGHFPSQFKLVSECPPPPLCKDDNDTWCKIHRKLSTNPKHKQGLKKMCDNRPEVKRCYTCGKCKRTTPTAAVKCQETESTKKFSGRADIGKVCKKNFEPKWASADLFGMSLYDVECKRNRRHQYYQVYEQSRQMFGQITKRTRTEKEVCQPITEHSKCYTDNMIFKDTDHNKSGMYILPKNQAFESGKPLEVQCTHKAKGSRDAKMATLECVGGVVLPNYECPEIDQQTCPDAATKFKPEELKRIDVEYGCVENHWTGTIWNSSAWKCKYLNQYGAYKRAEAYELNEYTNVEC